ncbi:nucleotide exchange factor GrpE [Rhodanobacter sp. AS-Z3]|uniref:nucleotide exchange factor GrpE n=1 Tax=Rhodanobacter sp. AS-Z3 TaxID=3031330 RepID=UPI00247A3513|nr:nucleotide exchange factor GrpE [Rhodanobacter sp. AS-Z3]WEN13852.1 nucleotide exchange factor GrpE [Rhodanobacter sp. AS-Z3]
MQNNDPYASGDMPVDGQADDTTHISPEALQARVAELEASNAELRETVLREHAELDNQRRRLHRDLEQARRFANEKLLGELLPVYDGLESGLATAGGDVASMREGLGLTLKALLKVGENHGMAQVDPLGQPLDPERHHAVSMVEAPGQAPGTVVSVLQKGYVLNDRLLRPALVSVAKD